MLAEDAISYCIVLGGSAGNKKDMCSKAAIINM